MDYVYELLIKEKKNLEIKLQEVCQALLKYDKPKEANQFEFIPNPVKGEEKIASYEFQEAAKEFVKDHQKDLYDKVFNLSINQKLLYTLKKNQRFMKIREMAEYLVDIIGGDTDDLVKQLSRRTGELKEINKIVKFQGVGGKKNTFWGSPNWLSEDGSIKEDYLYNEGLVKSKKGESLFDI